MVGPRRKYLTKNTMNDQSTSPVHLKRLKFWKAKEKRAPYRYIKHYWRARNKQKRARMCCGAGKVPFLFFRGENSTSTCCGFRIYSRGQAEPILQRRTYYGTGGTPLQLNYSMYMHACAICIKRFLSFGSGVVLPQRALFVVLWDVTNNAWIGMYREIQQSVVGNGCAYY